MGVNQHLRQLAQNELVRHISQQALQLVKPDSYKPGSSFIAIRMPVGAGLIRLRPCVYPGPQLGLGLPINDPRELFRSARTLKSSSVSSSSWSKSKPSLKRKRLEAMDRRERRAAANALRARATLETARRRVSSALEGRASGWTLPSPTSTPRRRLTVPALPAPASASNTALLSIIEGTLYGRNGFIGEYIRRRTGLVRDLHQILYRLDAVIRAATGDLTELRLRKWTNFLGSDLFPPAKPKRSSAKDIDETDDETPRLRTKKRKTQSASMKSSGSSFKAVDVKTARIRKPCKRGELLFPSSSKDSRAGNEADSNPFPAEAVRRKIRQSGRLPHNLVCQFAPTFTTPQPILSTSPPSPSSSPSSVPIATPILITVAPSRDPSTLVAALLNSGLSTISDAIDLPFMEDSTIRFFFEELGKRNGLGLLDLAWAAKAFEAARKEVAGM